MSLFRVTLRNIAKPSLSKVVDLQAPNREQAGTLATCDGFRVAMIKPLTGEAAVSRSKKGISKKELIKMFRGLSSMLKANISTADALFYYAQGLPDPALQTALYNIRDRLEAGLPVHVAFAKEGKFDATILTIIEAGADSGQLHEAFSALARRIKIEMTFSSKLRSALVVPCIVILFQIGLFIWSQTGVVKQVEDTLKSIRQEPDALSKGIFAFSHVVQFWWPFFIAGLIAFAVALVRSANFRQNLLEFLMRKWTILRKLVMGLRQMAYIGTLQMLYANGINLARASSLSAKVVEGTSLHPDLVKAAKVYETSGIQFSEALRRNVQLDPQVTHMIGIGEKSASLPQQLELLRDIYEDDTAQYMADFTEIINFITLAMAVILIALVFTGSMLPIFLMGPRMMNSGNM
jgi:type II secretory pathway component PulF